MDAGSGAGMTLNPVIAGLTRNLLQKLLGKQSGKPYGLSVDYPERVAIDPGSRPG